MFKQSGKGNFQVKRVFLFAFLLVFVFLATAVAIAELKEIESVHKRAKENSQKLSGALKNRLKDDKLEKEAKEAHEFFQGSEFQKKVREYQGKLQEKFLGNRTIKASSPRRYPEVFYKYSKDVLVLNEDEVLYVFISSSVPKEVIRHYLAEAEKVEGTVNFVLRGGIGGLKYLRPTIKYVVDLLKKDESCDFTSVECEVYSSGFLIDPFLFRKFEIKAVPVVVYERRGIEVISPGAISFKRHVKRIGEVLKDERFLVFGNGS